MMIRMTTVAMGLVIALSARAEDWTEVGRAAVGGAIGGVIGNQIGDGRGRTAATVVGAAAGTLIASGCKVGAGTAVGGLLGGLLGSQVGGGNGKNVMAGVGGAVGAWLGSDCSPVASAAVPVALAGPAFRFNGISMTPVNGFPVEAFGGVPPMTSTDDLATAREVTRRLVASAGESVREGDQETAMLKMYWAKRIGLQETAITAASLRAVSSIAVGTPQRGMGRATVTVTIPPKTLVIVPAFDQDGHPRQVSAALDGEVRLGTIDWSTGIQVADNGTAGVMEVLRILGGNPNQARGSQSAVRPGSRQAPSRAAPLPVADMLGLPEGQPLRMADGSYILKTPGNLTIYNGNEQPTAVALDKLDFVPRTPVPSAGRQAAGALMHTINEGVKQFAFNDYARHVSGFSVRFEAPNRIVDVLRNTKPVGYTDGAGRVSTVRTDGERAYQADPIYRTAANVLGGAMKTPAVVDFEAACHAERFGVFGTLSGEYSSTLRKICFKGNFNGGAVTQVATRTFVIGEDGTAVQTVESMMTDKQILATMKKALAGGQLASDLAGLTATPFGNLESALQCFGSDTLTQMAFVEAARIGKGDVGLRSNAAGTGYAAARIAGWTPPVAEWGVGRIANCVGAIPIIGTGAVALKQAAVAGEGVLKSLPDLPRLQNVFDAFGAPQSFNNLIAGVRSADELWPGNPKAATFVKNVFDATMSGLGIGQVGLDMVELHKLAGG